ncbi:MAG: ammonium transporter [Nitrososphaerales archaeon]
MKVKNRFLLCLVLAPSMITVSPAFAADPVGDVTLAGDPYAPVNFTWTLISAFLVFLMQGGFAMLEGGLVRAKNVSNIMMKNLSDFAIGSLGFWAIGFPLMFGASVAGIFGASNWLLTGEAYDVSTYLLWIFQMVFAGTAATITSGAMAERTKFRTYYIISFIITTFIYPVYGHWVWGGGWLSALPFGVGHVDFAGSGVVHMVGGGAGLAGALLLGARIGKYDENGKPRALPGHSISMVMLGVFLLWFGWFGFNPGSTLAATELRISVIAVTTLLAGSAGGVAATLYTWKKFGRPDVTMAGNGVIAGLVAITAPSAWVEAWAAVVIGLAAGLIMVESVLFFERKGVDDPIGAISCHLIAGIWGLISVGIFADGTYGLYTTEAPRVVGLLYGGGIGQLVAQLIGVAANFAWVFGASFTIFWVLKKTMGLRVSKEEELEGLDMSEHGAVGYPYFVSRPEERGE